MSILPINVFGDSILRKKAKKVTEIDDNIIGFIRNMQKSMLNANGIGLAANQVGSDKAIFVVDVSSVEGYEKTKPIVFINPRIKEFSKEKVYIEEGCLSIPLLRAEVRRPKELLITYFDTDLKEHSLEADKILARVIQHEFDHLNGILFVDHLDEEERGQLKPELERIRKRDIDIDYPLAGKKLHKAV